MASSNSYLKQIQNLKSPKFVTESQATKNAKKQYASSGASQTTQINNYLKSIANNNIDSSRFQNLYNMYKNEYDNIGRAGVNESAVQTNALDGGYGNDYGADVAEQSFNNGADSIGATIPDLYSAASSAAKNDLNDRYNAISTLQDRRNADTEKYGNLYSASQDNDSNVNNSTNAYWNANLDRLKSLYSTMLSAENAKASSSGSSRRSSSSGTTKINSGKSNNSNNNQPTKSLGYDTYNTAYKAALKETNNGITLLNPKEYSARGNNMSSYADYVVEAVKKYKTNHTFKKKSTKLPDKVKF